MFERPRSLGPSPGEITAAEEYFKGEGMSLIDGSILLENIE
jgi:hypothetical protein